MPSTANSAFMRLQFVDVLVLHVAVVVPLVLGFCSRHMTSSSEFTLQRQSEESAVSCTRHSAIESCSTSITPLADGRQNSESGQCRVLCSAFNHKNIVARLELGCEVNPCKDDRVLLPFNHPTSNGDLMTCIPRGMCIELCGSERPGCVYTGSCDRQVCFEGKKSSLPAVLPRVTYHGPDSVIHVNETNDNGTTSIFSTLKTESRQISVDIALYTDYCGKDKLFALTSPNCRDGDISFLGDGTGITEQGSIGQCRSVCRDVLKREPLVEIVRVKVDCNFCAEDALTFISNDSGSPVICIPREECIRRCGKERDGCVYTGSCESQLCFSGIDSKKPAIMEWESDDGSDSTWRVDNSGCPVSRDAPAFAKLVNKEIENVTCYDLEQENSEKSKPVKEIGDDESEEDDDESSSKWPWLGPLIGVGGAIIIASATVIGAIISRPIRSNANTNNSSSGKEDEHRDAE